ncbi:MAG: hypothetical protein GY861_04275 [bacterium]|nr:hypothetical protein [bacterium]
MKKRVSDIVPPEISGDTFPRTTFYYLNSFIIEILLSVLMIEKKKSIGPKKAREIVIHACKTTREYFSSGKETIPVKKCKLGSAMANAEGLMSTHIASAAMFDKLATHLGIDNDLREKVCDRLRTKVGTSEELNKLEPLLSHEDSERVVHALNELKIEIAKPNINWCCDITPNAFSVVNSYMRIIELKNHPKKTNPDNW